MTYADNVLELSDNFRDVCFNLIGGHVSEVASSEVVLANVKCVQGVREIFSLRQPFQSCIKIRQ